MGDEVDKLVSALAAEGELDGSGVFTIDSAAALDKLGEFQFVEPIRFVLCWVRAAVMFGAREIAIEVDADDLWVLAWEARVPGPAALDQLWSAIVSREDASLASLGQRELALGISGAFSWGAKHVRVDAGSERLEVEPSFALRRESRPAAELETEPTLVVHAKRALGWDLLKRYRLDRRGELPEELLLARACAHARTPIVLEGKTLNARGPTLKTTEIDEGDLRGRLLLRRGQRSVLRLLKAEVEVEVRPLELGAGWVEAVVDDPRLPLDLAQDKPVEGPRLAALLAAVSRARWRAWFRVARETGRHDETLVEDIFASTELGWRELEGASAYCHRVSLERADRSSFGDRLALGGQHQLPRVRLEHDRELLPRPSLAALFDFHAVHDFVFWSPDEQPALAGHERVPIIHRADGPLLRALGRVDLREPEGRARHRLMVREATPLGLERQLPMTEWVSIERRFGPYHARLAWQRGLGSWSGTLVLGSGGQRMAEFGLPETWGPLRIEIDGPFASEPGGLGPAEIAQQQLAFALLGALDGVPDLYASYDAHGVLDGFARKHILQYMLSARARWSARRLRELSALSRQAIDAAEQAWADAELGGWGVVSAWQDDEPGPGRRWTKHPISSLRCLDRGAERWASLAEARACIEAHGELPYASSDTPDPDPEPLSDEVWLLPPLDLSVLVDAFGPALTRFDRRAWARREPRAPRASISLSNAALSLSFTGPDGIEGALALPFDRVPGQWSKPIRRGATLLASTRGHALAPIVFELPVGPFYGVIELPEAVVSDYGDHVVRDSTWLAAAQGIEACALALAHAYFETRRASTTQPEDERARINTWTLDLDELHHLQPRHLDPGWVALAAEWRRWRPSLLPLRASP